MASNQCANFTIIVTALFASVVLPSVSPAQQKISLPADEDRHMSNPTDPASLQATSRQSLEAARRAFDAWKQSLETGDERFFSAVLEEDVRFVVNLPFDQWRGEHRGRARVEELIRFERDKLELRPRITLLDVLANGNRVAFEWGIIGTVMGKARRPDTRNLIIFEMQGDKVAYFREFFGNVD